MTQIAAETLGLSMEDVSFKLGDSRFAFAPYEGGSSTAASVGTAVQYACAQVKEKLIKLARGVDQLPFKKVKDENIVFTNGALRDRENPEISITIAELMNISGTKVIEEKSTDLKAFLKQMGYSRNTHSAVFVEVKVDKDLGLISVTRVVSAIAAGNILNPCITTACQE